jgi:hypothetical protein
MELFLKIGDSTTFTLPLRWKKAAFTPGNDWSLIFTAKSDPDDSDANAKIQKATGAGLTATGSNAALDIVPADTLTLPDEVLFCDIQAQHTTSGEVRTVWQERWQLARDITRETTTSIPIFTTAPGFVGIPAQSYLDPSNNLYGDPDGGVYFADI